MGDQRDIGGLKGPYPYCISKLKIAFDGPRGHLAFIDMVILGMQWLTSMPKLG